MACRIVQAVEQANNETNGKWQILISWGSETPERTWMKLGIYNYVVGMTTHANPCGTLTTLEIERTDRCCSETESVTAQICSGRNRTEPQTQIRASRRPPWQSGRRVARQHSDNWHNDGHLMPPNSVSQVGLLNDFPKFESIIEIFYRSRFRFTEIEYRF